MSEWEGAAPDTADYVPTSAWQQVHIEARDVMTLSDAGGRTELAVTVVNDSSRVLEPHSGQGILFSFRLIGIEGLPIHFEGPRTPLSGPVPAGGRHSQTIRVAIPHRYRDQVTAIRVGLIQRGRYWVERIHRGHPKTVRVVFGNGSRMTHTQRVIARAAELWPQGRGNGLPWPHGAMMVSERHRLLYVPVAKCACTSLKSMMVELAGIRYPEQAIELGVHLVTDRFNTGVQLKDKPLPLARDILASDRYDKFCVIREPFERLVSAYMEKFVYNRQHERNLLHTRPVISRVQGREDIDLQRGISFDEFLACILAQDPMDLDPHWRPQQLYLAGVQHLNRIFRMEEIAGLEAWLNQRFGIAVKLEHRNRTRKSERQIADVAQMSADRIEALGAIDHASFQASRHRAAVRDYFKEDFDLYKQCREAE